MVHAYGCWDSWLGFVETSRYDVGCLPDGIDVIFAEFGLVLLLEQLVSGQLGRQTDPSPLAVSLGRTCLRLYGRGVV
jgi:hypothetical protein